MQSKVRLHTVNTAGSRCLLKQDAAGRRWSCCLLGIRELEVRAGAQEVVVVFNSVSCVTVRIVFEI